MFLLYHAYVYLEFLILACTIYILAPMYGEISVECSNSLKGILAICILAHHLYQYSGLFRNTVWGVCLQSAGYLSVACFLFLSGYGLFISCEKNGIKYIKNFAKYKIVPFYGMILLFTAIYFVEGIFLGERYPLPIIIESFTFGGTVILNGWYLQVQLLLYLFFFLTFRLISYDTVRIVLICVECFVFCIIMILVGELSIWYECIFAFPIGMIWAKYFNVSTNTFEKKLVCLGKTVFIGVLFCITFIGSYLIEAEILALTFKMASSILFAVSVAIAINLINIENRITRWLGKYSTEIYALQGFFLILYHSKVINLKNPYVYVLAVIISVCVAAVIVHPIIRKIYAIARK